MIKIVVFLLSFGVILAFNLSPTFFGINYWYFEKLSQSEHDKVLNLLKEIPVDVIRIGGMWYDAHGIKSWVLKDFFELCESLNATPVVQIPFNAKNTEDERAFIEKVRSMYDGRVIWSIGNEMDIYEDMNVNWLAKEDFRTFMSKYGKFVRTLEELEGDPFLIGPDFSWKWRPWMMGDWTTPFMKKYRDHLDVFVVHRYPFRYVFKTSEIVRDVIDFYTEMKRLKSKIGMKVGLTETNLSWDWNYCGPLSPEGDWAGIWYASILLRSMVLDLWSVSIWSTVNDSCLSLINIHGNELVLRPTYEVLKIFKGIPRSVDKWYLSRYVDYVILNDTVIAVNRSERKAEIKIGRDIITLDGLSVSKFHKADEGWKMSRIWRARGEEKK